VTKVTPDFDDDWHVNVKLQMFLILEPIGQQGCQKMLKNLVFIFLGSNRQVNLPLFLM
jgi:hypothetical protein